MGDIPYTSSEQGGGLIIHHGLTVRITICDRLQEKDAFRAKLTFEVDAL